MQNEKKILSKRLLHLLTKDELKQLYNSLGKNELYGEESRGFIISKIPEGIKDQDLLQNEGTMKALFDRIIEIIAFIEDMIYDLERVDIIKVYENITSQKLKREDDIKKSEVVKRLLDEITLNQIIKNKRFQERLKPKYLSVTDIKSLEEGLQLLRDETNRTSNKIEFLFERVRRIDELQKEINGKITPLDQIFETKGKPNFEDFLKALYEQSISMGEKPSPESFKDLLKQLQEKLDIDERTFVLKGTELLLSHYLMSEVKSLLWRPSFEQFTKVLMEEILKINPSGDRADIPSLRIAVSERLGINHELFDELLAKAWTDGKVKLEAGAPIGEFNVKYLVTKDGQKFYYVGQK